MKGNIDISVIIPTYSYYNRANNLNDILDVLKDQEIRRDINFEIIIVDNGCVLNSDELLNRYENIKNLIIIHEPEIGLSTARNTGVLSAKGDIIAFIDDDVIPSKKWLNYLFESYSLPDALCVGGPVIIKNDNQLFPKWFSIYFKRFLLPQKFPKGLSVIVPPFYLIGANMSFRKIVFERYGLFDTSLGRKGNCLLSGEDTEFILRLNDKNVYCNDQAVVFTKVKADRITRRFFLKRIFWQAVSEARIFRKHGLSRFYDVDELFLSTEFIEIFFKNLKKGNFFELTCIIVRFIVFKFFVIFKL